MANFLKFCVNLNESEATKRPIQNSIIVGDFNSNKIWNEWDRCWNHSDVVRELSEIGIESLYHKFTNEIQGEETKPTFFLQRKIEKPYHIDFCFAPKGLSDKLLNLEIGNYDDWKE